MKDVLLIDDESSLLRLLQRILESAGYSVVTASNGLDGLNTYYATQPTLVITDILMPGVEGTDVIRTINHTDSEQKIIAMSGGGKTLTSKTIFDVVSLLNIEGTLSKPFSKQEVLSAVELAIGKATRGPLIGGGDYDTCSSDRRSTQTTEIAHASLG